MSSLVRAYGAGADLSFSCVNGRHSDCINCPCVCHSVTLRRQIPSAAPTAVGAQTPEGEVLSSAVRAAELRTIEALRVAIRLEAEGLAEDVATALVVAFDVAADTMVAGILSYGEVTRGA